MDFILISSLTQPCVSFVARAPKASYAGLTYCRPFRAVSG